MSWIGLSDQDTSVFRRIGINGEPKVDAENAKPDQALTRGTLWLQFDAHVSEVRRNLLRYGAREPYASGLHICLEPDATISILCGQDKRNLSLRLPTPMFGQENGVLLSLAWDNGTRALVVSLYAPDSHILCQSELRAQLPLSLRDWRRIIDSRHHTKVDPSVAFWAVSDELEPIGATATFGPHCMLMTPQGATAVEDLRPGQFVITANGDIAQVRWTGKQVVPARGRFAPHLIRAPYFGAHRDVVMAAEQRLCLQGSEVEYNFGLEAVGATVGQLVNARSVLPVRGARTIEYYQFLLDRPAILEVSGVKVCAFDPALHNHDPATLRHSLLRDLPRELIPEFEPIELHQLRPFEASMITL